MSDSRLHTTDCPRRVVVAVTNDLVTDQRVRRTCCALMEAGYEVTLVGRRLPESASVRRKYRTVRMRLLFRKKMWFYAEYNLRLLLRLLFAKADAFYANDADTLPACAVAARLRRKRLFVDAHEAFAEVPELVGRPKVQRCWQAIERRWLPKADGSVTVCQSVADYYRERYGVEMTVVRNVPHRLPCPEAKRERGLILYQGAVNVGRCVDCAIDAMQYLPQCRLAIAGAGDELEHLCQYTETLPWKERIDFLGRLEPEKLAGVTATARLGLCLLENRGLNYYYSLPNRIGDYAWAGVPVLASDFPEIRRVVEAHGIGHLVGEEVPHDACKLADAISATLQEWEAMPNEERQRRFDSARKDMDWGQEKNILLGAFDAIF